MPQNPGDPGSTNQYGPFTDAITGPLTAREQPAGPPVTYGGTGATLAQFANAFIQGAQRGQRTKYEQSERQKQEAEANFDMVHQHIQNSPNISYEGKQAAEQQYLLGKFGRVQDGLAANKDDKDHPLMNLMKAMSGAVIGPNENKAHKNLDVNQMLSIIQDPKYKIDPRQISSDIGGKFLNELNKMGPQTLPGTPNAPTAQSPQVTGAPGETPAMVVPASEGDGQVGMSMPSVPLTVAPTTAPPMKIPGTDLPGFTTPGQDVNLLSVGRNPAIQQLNADLYRQTGTSLDSNPFTKEAYNSIPKFAPDKPIGKPETFVGPTGQTLERQQYQTAAGSFYYGQAYIPAAPPKMLTPPTQKQLWIVQDGKTVPVLLNTRVPGSPITDVNTGKPVSGAYEWAPSPSDGGGQGRTYSMMAYSSLKTALGREPTREEVKDEAGKLATENYGSIIGQRKQNEEFTTQQTGIVADNSFGGKPTVKPPAPAPATAGAGATTAPPANPAAQSASLGLFRSPEDVKNANIYLSTVGGTGKAPGKSSILAQKGMQALGEATGLNGIDLATEVADYQATSKALKDSIGVSGAFSRLQETIAAHGQLAVDAAKAFGPSNVPFANHTIQWLERNMGSHPELQKYDLAIKALQREYGKMIAGGAQSRAMTPVGAMKEGEFVISQSATIKDVQAAVDQLKLEANTEQGAFGKQQQGLRDKIAQSRIGQALPQSVDRTAAPTVKPPAEDQVEIHVRTPSGSFDTMKVGKSQVEATKKMLATEPQFKGYSLVDTPPTPQRMWASDGSAVDLVDGKWIPVPK